MLQKLSEYMGSPQSGAKRMLRKNKENIPRLFS